MTVGKTNERTSPSEKSIYDIAAEAMFAHEETRKYPSCNDDLIIWPNGDHCNAEDLPDHGHMSDDYLRVQFDSDAYDVVQYEIQRAAELARYVLKRGLTPSGKTLGVRPAH